jgi:ABC-type proline/glycine betaine transport system permease subunit
MEKTCNCGSSLPSDAHFCPHCGRPQTKAAESMRRARSEGERLAELQVRKTPPIGFGNSAALRSAYIGALLAAFLTNLPFLNLLCFIWYPAAGFFSVYSYRRRTGRLPSTQGGAKLGWITGVMTFAISLVLTGLTNLFPSEEGSFTEVFRKTIEAAPGEEAVKRQMIELIENPIALVFLIVAFLVTYFLLLTGFTTLGGALGAKVLEED